MKYGEKFEITFVDWFTKKRSLPWLATYKYVEYGEYHTDNLGEGLWRGTKQILGTCQFSVAGCKTEKAAKAKIRRWVRGERLNGRYHSAMEKRSTWN